MSNNQPTPAVRAAEQYPMWLVTRDGKPMCARPTENQAKVYSYGFSKSEGIEIVEGVFAPAAIIDAGVPQEPWRAISEAPRELVIIVTDGEHIAFSELCPRDGGGEYWAEDGDGGLDWTPTLWQPLPTHAHEFSAHGPVAEAREIIYEMVDCIKQSRAKLSIEGPTSLRMDELIQKARAFLASNPALPPDRHEERVSEASGVTVPESACEPSESLVEAICSALYDCSTLRHALFTPPQFSRLVREIVGKAIAVDGKGGAQ